MTATLPGQTILLVEDDPPIRSLISYMLRGQGYQVLQTCNGQEALSVAEKHPGPIDLLVTDLVMPRTKRVHAGRAASRVAPGDPCAVHVGLCGAVGGPPRGAQDG